MRRYFYWCAFIGAGLLLVAVWLAAHDPLAAHRDQARPIARVAQVVAYLDSECAYCHDPVTHAPAKRDSAAVHHSFEQPWYSAPSTTEVLNVWPSQATIDAELVNLGEGILALAEHENEHTNDIAQAYLQLHDETRRVTAMSDSQLRQTLQDIADIQDLLQMATNQASPVQWRPNDGQRQTCQINAGIFTPLSASVDMPRPGVLICETMVISRTVIGGNPFNIPLEVIYSVRRRGPPADTILDFGQDRRLLSLMQSPFILPYRSGRECELWDV